MPPVARCCVLGRSSLARRGDPAWRHANRTVLCWSGMTDAEHNGPCENNSSSPVNQPRQIEVKTTEIKLKMKLQPEL